MTTASARARSATARAREAVTAAMEKQLVALQLERLEEHPEELRAVREAVARLLAAAGVHPPKVTLVLRTATAVARVAM